MPEFIIQFAIAAIFHLLFLIAGVWVGYQLGYDRGFLDYRLKQTAEIIIALNKVLHRGEQ